MGGKPTSTRITAFVPSEVAEVLKEWAKSENRTMSNLAATILLNAAEIRQTKQTQEASNKEDAA